MTSPRTLLQIAGAPNRHLDWNAAALVLIDIQREYNDGKLALGNGGEKAREKSSLLLEKARHEGAPVFHIAHRGPGGAALFDCDGPGSEIDLAVTPSASEVVIGKTLPNAFHGTDLQAQIEETGRTQILYIGFMTHMCVSSTARAGLDLGFDNFVASDACYTRDLPGHDGSVVPAAAVHAAALAALNDRFATVRATADIS